MQACNLDDDSHPVSCTTALAGLIGDIGRPRFSASALSWLNTGLVVGSWSVYQLWADRPPVLHLSASHEIEDRTAACFAAYRDGLYRRDRSFDTVRRAKPSGAALMLRMHADQAPNDDHREAIYRRHGMLERLSVARREDDGSVLAVNLYHHNHQGCFSDAEVERFAGIAPLLLPSVARHLDWQREQQPMAPAPVSLRESLARRCPRLTLRELDVLERLLQGMSYDGIAQDMGLSVATVKTYRSRAFQRLGIHFKSQLFASFLPGSRPA